MSSVSFDSRLFSTNLFTLLRSLCAFSIYAYATRSAAFVIIASAIFDLNRQVVRSGGVADSDIERLLRKGNPVKESQYQYRSESKESHHSLSAPHSPESKFPPKPP